MKKIPTKPENGLETASDARMVLPVALDRDVRGASGREMLASRLGIARLGVRSRPRPTPTPTDGERDCIRVSSYEEMAASISRLEGNVPKWTWDAFGPRLLRVLAGGGNQELIEGVRREGGERGAR
jgi:hypothetical protein